MRKTMPQLMGLLILSFVIATPFSHTSTVSDNIPSEIEPWQMTYPPLGPTAAATKTKSTSVTIEWTVPEANAIIKMYISINGDNWMYTSDNWATTTANSYGGWRVTVPLTQGQTTGIAFTTTNAGGNESTMNVLGYVISDTSAPTVTISSPTTGTVTDNVCMTITGSVAKDSWEAYAELDATIKVGNATAGYLALGSGGSFSVSAALLYEGVNTITIEVTDVAGNMATASVSIERTATLPTTYVIIIVVMAVMAAVVIFRKW